jgi:plasmid stability protein
MAEKKKPPSHELERFIVRLPDGMRERIAASAKASERSMNAEIVHRLEQSFSSEGAIEQIAASAEKIREFFSDPRLAEAIYERRRGQAAQAREAAQAHEKQVSLSMAEPKRPARKRRK